MRTRVDVLKNKKLKPNACHPTIPPRNCRTHKRLEGDVARPHPAYAKTLLHTTYCAHCDPAFQLPKSKFQMSKKQKPSHARNHDWPPIAVAHNAKTRSKKYREEGTAHLKSSRVWLQHSSTVSYIDPTHSCLVGTCRNKKCVDTEPNTWH